MLKMTIDNEEVLSNNDISIKEEILSPSSTILNNVYPKSWELDKDYTSRFYYPKDYSKLNIQNFSIEPEEAGKTIQINGSATLTDVDTSKESRVLRLLGQTSQTGTPTPSSPIPINVVSGDNTIDICGKNLYITNQDTYSWKPGSAGWKFVDGTNGANGTNIVNTIYKAKVISGQTYTFTANITADSSIVSALVYDNENPIKRIDGTNVNYSETFTSSRDGYIILRFYVNANVSVNVNNVMLEAGSQVTAYEPYIGNSYPISLGSIELCKIGTYQDYIYKDNGSWYLHKEIGKVVLNGSEVNWTSQGTGENNVYIYQWSRGPQDKRDVINAPIYCDYFTQITIAQSDTKSVVGIANGQKNYFSIKIGTTTSTTLSDFKTWLATNTPVVYYQLATPTNTEITDTTLLEQLESLSS